MAYADVSLASTSVSNPVFGAATNFFFNSMGANGSNDQSARNSESATAALGSAQSSTGNQGQQAGVGQALASALQNSTGVTLSPTVLIVGGVAVVAVLGVIIWLSIRR